MTHLVFVGHRCGDHSPSSGYDQICSLFPEAGWLDGRELAEGRVTWHRRPAVSLHEDGSAPLFHVFYGDCSGSSLPAILRSKFPEATIVSSLHQPVARLAADPAARAALDHVDAVITVSDIQARQLDDLGLGIPVHSIPHGVRARAFRPSLPANAPRHHVLLVGTYLRDWQGARRVVDLLAGAGVSAVVVGANPPADLFAGHGHVEVAGRLSEGELARMYDRSAALFLPVLDATASNALLEAMAAGCPVVCPRLPSLVDEYLADASDSFEPKRYETAAARLLSYVKEPGRRAAKSHALMKRAEEFDWSRLKPRYARAYEEILARTYQRARAT